jgi:hypothetical protein
MTQFDNSNRGAIWKNKKKDAPTYADFTGSINVDGHDYWLNGWLRAPDASPESPSMRFTVKRKDGQPQQQAAAPRQQARSEMDDEIPF